VNSLGPWLRKAGDSETVRCGIGYMMNLDLEDLVQENIFFFGCYEKPLASYLASRLEKDMVFIDIGAHVGQYTLLAATKVGSSGHVYAFEPHPLNFEMLSRNVALNQFRNVTLYNMAVADQDGKSYLYINTVASHRKNTGTHSLCRQQNWADYSKVEVNVSQLDHMLRHVERVDVLKIDVEGAELLVLQGGEEIISKFKPIVAFEAEEPSATNFGYRTTATKKFLEQRGYRLFRIPRDGKRIYLTSTRANEPEKFSIILALPDEAAPKRSSRADRLARLASR
jgi:FkbM family methyltransferase